MDGLIGCMQNLMPCPAALRDWDSHAIAMLDSLYAPYLCHMQHVMARPAALQD
jgi:hypothetical protein